MFTFTASVGQSASQGMQYQHSSYFMCALPVSGLIHRTSSGQTSMQTRQPFSAMHFSSSTMTGTAERWVATGMVDLLGFGQQPTMAAVVGAYSSLRSGSLANGFAHWTGIGGLLPTQAVV